MRKSCAKARFKLLNGAGINPGLATGPLKPFRLVVANWLVFTQEYGLVLLGLFHYELSEFPSVGSILLPRIHRPYNKLLLSSLIINSNKELL
jgi:hypothetical protein